MRGVIASGFPTRTVWLACSLLLAACISGGDDDGDAGIGKDWTDRSGAVGVQGLLSVTWTGEQLVAVGVVGTVVTSPDGISWTHRNQSGELILTSVTWTGSRLVAVGYRHTNDSDVALTSMDGIDWTVHGIGRAGSKLSCVAWGGGQLVAVGDSGIVLTSPDGSSWARRTSGTMGRLGGVVWNGGKWVATGGESSLSSPGIALTSADGFAWTKHSARLEYPLSSVIWAGNGFVAVGERGLAATSPGGVEWTARTDWELAFVGWLTSVVWTGKVHVAVGSGGAAFTSPDGITWTRGQAGTNAALASVVWTGNRLVAVGGGGTVMTSP